MPAAAWVDSGARRARASLVPTLDDTGQKVADALLDRLLVDKDLAETVSGLAFSQVAELVHGGQDEEARRVWLREVASFDEAQDELVGAIRNAHVAHLQRAATWRRVRELVVDLLKIAGPIALQVLVAML